jgi:hypothetical protein
MDRDRSKACIHNMLYAYSTPKGDWYECSKCGYKELRVW